MSVEHEDEYFKYHRLDLSTDAIRLVRLLKGNGPEPIRCELIETFLHQTEGIPYEALSYAWGKSRERSISLNGRKAFVMENLYTALHALRQPEEDRLLWIDAICIDQENHKEKGHQVGQMRRIYESTEQVIIWLGPSNPGIDSLMDLVKWWDAETIQQPGAHHAQTWIDSWTRIISHHRELGEKVDTECWRRALKDILMLPWFQRVWILQEASSTRRATLLCGSKAVPSRGFSLLPFLLEIEPDAHTQAVLHILPGYRRKETWWGEAQNFETLLVKFSHSKATDPKDKIYALLGIASDARSSGTLCPDYEIWTGEAIRNTISFLLFQEVRDPSCLPLPKDLNFDDLLRVLLRLPEYVVSWAVLHDCPATVTATLPQVSDISEIPYNFWLDGFDTYFHPLRMLVVKVLAKKDPLHRYTIRTVFQWEDVHIDPRSFTSLILALVKFGDIKLARFILQQSSWEVEAIEALLCDAAQDPSVAIFKPLFSVCEPIVRGIGHRDITAVLKEAAILDGPLARLSRWPDPWSDSNIVKDEAWYINTAPCWMGAWLRELSVPTLDPVSGLHCHLSSRSHSLDGHDDKIAFLILVVAALTMKKRSGLNLSIRLITQRHDQELCDLLPTRWLPGEWLSELSKLPYVVGFSPTDDALVNQARKGLGKQMILAGKLEEAFLSSLSPKARFPVSQPPLEVVRDPASDEANLPEANPPEPIQTHGVQRKRQTLSSLPHVSPAGSDDTRRKFELLRLPTRRYFPRSSRRQRNCCGFGLVAQGCHDAIPASRMLRELAPRFFDLDDTNGLVSRTMTMKPMLFQNLLRVVSAMSRKIYLLDCLEYPQFPCRLVNHEHNKNRDGQISEITLSHSMTNK